MTNNILLVYGGNSVEHEISIITALQIKNQYKGKYHLILCYLKDGKFYISPKLEKIDFYKSISKNIKNVNSINFNANENLIKVKHKKLHFDAVWIVAHGSNCEDGTLYSYFKTLNIDVIGEKPSSAIIGQNKYLTKKCTSVNTIPFYELNSYDYNHNLEKIMEETKKLGFPVILKPVDLGSSVGIHSANNIDEMMDSVEELFHLSSSIIIEKKINHFMELNISVFQYKDEFILSDIEKVSNNHVLSYKDKYVNNQKSMVGQKKELPANISNELKKQIQSFALKIYKDLKAQYIVRMDFLYDLDNDALYFNEINNIPGSLALYLYDSIGFKCSDILDMYIDEGLKNINNEKELITTYQDNIFMQQNFNNVKFNK